MDIRIGGPLTPHQPQARARPEEGPVPPVVPPAPAASEARPVSQDRQGLTAAAVERTLKPWDIPMLPRRPRAPYGTIPGQQEVADPAEAPENSAPARFPL